MAIESLPAVLRFGHGATTPTTNQELTLTQSTRLRLKPYLPRLYLVVLAVFAVNKLWIRPWVLDRDLPRAFDIAVLSWPNAAEAIIGLGVCTALLHLARHQLRPRWDQLPRLWIDLTALTLAGTYVLTQEFKLHHLGGRNTFDPYDVVASVLGLLIMFAVLRRYGAVEPS